MKLDLSIIGSRAGSILAILALWTAGLAFVDVRYASAGDLESLEQLVLGGQVASMEFRIEEVETEIAILQARANPTEIERITLAALEARRARYLRQLAILTQQGTPP